MRVKYYGSHPDCPYRHAWVSWRSEEEKEAEAICILMRKEYGWDYDMFDECALFMVWDREEYGQFMEDWKEAKRRVREEKRTCSKH